MIATSLWDHLGRNFAELIDRARKDFDAKCRSQPIAHLIAVLHERDACQQAGQRAEDSHDDALREKHADDLHRPRAERLHDADLARLLDSDSDQRIHDAEGGNEDDEEKKKKHDVPLHANSVEELLVEIYPGEGHDWEASRRHSVRLSPVEP